MLASKRLAVVLVTPAGSNLDECMDVIVRFFHAAKPQLLPIGIIPHLRTLLSNTRAEKSFFLSNPRSPKAKYLAEEREMTSGDLSLDEWVLKLMTEMSGGFNWLGTGSGVGRL
jgi:hypothetical protein